MTCLICRKHRGDGPLVGPEVWRGDLVVVTCHPAGFPGHLLVDSRRHAPGLADLTDAEAEAVGWAVRRAAAALRAELAPEAVFTAVLGRAVPHFHQHVLARHPGTHPTSTRSRPPTGQAHPASPRRNWPTWRPGSPRTSADARPEPAQVRYSAIATPVAKTTIVHLRISCGSFLATRAPT
ncbi:MULTISPECIES: HIT family protein [Actinosynnema]|uniref:HIT family protein n=1 Tax=Actinosynnema TaxID=40566 RepID=UPI0020A5B6EC|nr:HIT domain-containing protein [Actinosynnema pretiosum]MCP2094395.1 Diadenosine tetraphosphate (Ap4A) hydrolase [Actinosynnema pretiosum]